MKKITACVLVILLLTFALPMLMLFAASFFQGDLISFLKGETVFLQASWQRYTIMFDNEELLIQLMNSIKIALSTLILQLPLSVLGGLFLARSSIKGVGLKVASCAALFGLEKYDAFPIDVWIKKVAEKRFAGEEFSAARFGRYAGIAQQFLFYYERYCGE